MSNIFLNGEKVQLIDVLMARENRQKKQIELLNLNRHATLISVTMNIPGEVKVTNELTQIFERMQDKIAVLCSETILLKKSYIHKIGYEGYFLVKNSPKSVKQILVEIEETDTYGRLFDLDVIFLEKNNLKILSRRDFNLAGRTCFICHDDAKVCGRNREHTVEELQMVISDFINERRDILNDKKN